ncbi:hypothetical protein SACIG1176_2293 [Staphylococcus aureus subsp. aureus CIG1176]|uniref:Uncharacterized protein n=2 Tax=Staphylococcus aureus TaxID=1280 RepID=A0A0E1X578_STAAU|nr:conserved hypothetical protein [Staphylococcus aureus subsp. aureus 68-397]EFH94572.1 hypothetical protein HMPREF0769_12193 [Staphylococcus aureus subsp. aureus MN8]EFK81323.1 hypothetical protein HMPREF0773_11527 [Staphylococcus aureus subsp. aureus TCH70]EHM57488.1 hypothetical protein SA21178_2640 [Staphylococcus aureus subsp. aureus 21178]EHS71226.1 hypothetical protein IS125_3075 [Staphylococcus aureus subsp. aureus IS-125]EHT26708.1 hypothetical protein SACIG1214_2238 [Staphylococcus 
MNGGENVSENKGEIRNGESGSDQKLTSGQVESLIQEPKKK